MEFAWQGVGSGWVQRWLLREAARALPAGAMPASGKTDPLVAQAEPVSDGGSLMVTGLPFSLD